MNKIKLIVAREFLTRVKTKQFWILSLLGPLLMGGFIAIMALVATKDGSDQTILIKDEYGIFKNAPLQSKRLNIHMTDLPLKVLMDSVRNDSKVGVLVIPSNINLARPQDNVQYFSQTPLGPMPNEKLVNGIIERIENKRLQENGISRTTLDSLKVGDFTLNARMPEGDEKSSEGAFGLAYGASILMYMFILLYGVQVMRGVAEEKSNRIMEVMVSSVKPFQLMMGKILGIGSTALLQFALWVGLSLLVTTVAGQFIAGDPESIKEMADQGGKMAQQGSAMSGISDFFSSADFGIALIVFIFYFIMGYLMYAALFAAVGSAVDQEQDTQQLTFPVTMPLIIGFFIAQTAAQDPNSQMAFWASMIPFTSPIVMMVRVAFGAYETWELILSMVILVGSFVGVTFMSAKIYRVGVLMYGKKVTLKEIGKWIFYKG